MYGEPTTAFATAYYHWFFLIQPFDLPGATDRRRPRLLPAAENSAAWGSAGLSIFDPRALAEYERCFSEPATVHATCEDYRAAAGIDLEHDAADATARM